MFIAGVLGYLILPWSVKLMMSSSNAGVVIQNALLSLVIVGISILGVLYYMTKKASFTYYSTQNFWLKRVLYIPCLVEEYIEKWIPYIRYDIKKEPKATWFILLGELVLVGSSLLYFMSGITDAIDKPRGGIMLQNDPVYTNTCNWSSVTMII